jgi:hypothetical protein
VEGAAEERSATGTGAATMMNVTASSLTPGGKLHTHMVPPDVTVFTVSGGPDEWHTHAPDPEKPGHSTEDCGHRHALPP